MDSDEDRQDYEPDHEQPFDEQKEGHLDDAEYEQQDAGADEAGGAEAGHEGDAEGEQEGEEYYSDDFTLDDLPPMRVPAGASHSDAGNGGGGGARHPSELEMDTSLLTDDDEETNSWVHAEVVPSPYAAGGSMHRLPAVLSPVRQEASGVVSPQRHWAQPLTSGAAFRQSTTPAASAEPTPVASSVHVDVSDSGQEQEESDPLDSKVVGDDEIAAAIAAGHSADGDLFGDEEDQDTEADGEDNTDVDAEDDFQLHYNSSQFHDGEAAVDGDVDADGEGEGDGDAAIDPISRVHTALVLHRTHYSAESCLFSSIKPTSVSVRGGAGDIQCEHVWVDPNVATVFGAVCRQLVTEAVLSAQSGTIVAFGQIGTGKSRLMLGAPPNPDMGIVQLALQEACYCAFGVGRIGLRLSAVEVYRDTVRDLLETGSDVNASVSASINTSVHSISWDQDPMDEPFSDAVVIEGISVKRHWLTDLAQACQLAATAAKRRVASDVDITVAEAGSAPRVMSHRSSRGHLIIMLWAKSQHGESVLRLVDLAGNDTLDRFGFSPVQTEEAKANILSLHHLRAMVESAAQSSGLVSANNSKLTRVLQAVITASCRVAWLLCCNTGIESRDLTLSTLRFNANLLPSPLMLPPPDSDSPRHRVTAGDRPVIVDLLVRKLEQQTMKNADAVRVHSELRSELDDWRARFTAKEMELQDAIAQGKIAARQIASLQHELDQQRLMTQQMLRERNPMADASVMAQLEVIQATLHAREAAIAAREERAAEIDRETAQQQLLIDQIQEELQRKTTALAEQESAIAARNRGLVTRKETLEGLQQRLAAAEAAIAEREAALAEREAKTARSDTRDKKLVKVAQTIINQIRGPEALDVTLEGRQISTVLQDQIGQLMQQKQRLDEEVKTIRASTADELQAQRDRIIALEQQLSESRAQLQTTETKLQVASAQLESHEAEFAAAMAATATTGSEPGQVASQRHVAVAIDRARKEAVLQVTQQLRAQHAQAMADMETKIQQARTAAMQEMQRRHAAEMQQVAIKSAADLEASLQRERGIMDEARKKDVAEAKRALTESHNATLKAQVGTATRQLQEALEAARQEHEEAVHALVMKHTKELERSLSDARREAAQELAAIKAASTAETHKLHQEMQELRIASVRNVEAAVREATAASKQELVAAVEQKEAQLRTEHQSVMDTLQRRAETARSAVIAACAKEKAALISHNNARVRTASRLVHLCAQQRLVEYARAAEAAQDAAVTQAINRTCAAIRTQLVAGLELPWPTAFADIKSQVVQLIQDALAKQQAALSESREAIVAARDRDWVDKLAAVEQSAADEKAAAVADLRLQLSEEHFAEIQQLRAAHVSTLEQVTWDSEAHAQTAVSEAVTRVSTTLKQQHAADVADLETRYRTKMLDICQRGFQLALVRVGADVKRQLLTRVWAAWRQAHEANQRQRHKAKAAAAMLAVLSHQSKRMKVSFALRKWCVFAAHAQSAMERRMQFAAAIGATCRSVAIRKLGAAFAKLKYYGADEALRAANKRQGSLILSQAVRAWRLRHLAAGFRQLHQAATTQAFRANSADLIVRSKTIALNRLERLATRRQLRSGLQVWTAAVVRIRRAALILNHWQLITSRRSLAGAFHRWNRWTADQRAAKQAQFLSQGTAISVLQRIAHSQGAKTLGSAWMRWRLFMASQASAAQTQALRDRAAELEVHVQAAQQRLQESQVHMRKQQDDLEHTIALKQRELVQLGAQVDKQVADAQAIHQVAHQREQQLLAELQASRKSIGEQESVIQQLQAQLNAHEKAEAIELKRIKEAYDNRVQEIEGSAEAKAYAEFATELAEARAQLAAERINAAGQRDAAVAQTRVQLMRDHEEQNRLAMAKQAARLIAERDAAIAQMQAALEREVAAVRTQMMAERQEALLQVQDIAAGVQEELLQKVAQEAWNRQVAAVDAAEARCAAEAADRLQELERTVHVLVAEHRKLEAAKLAAEQAQHAAMQRLQEVEGMWQVASKERESVISRYVVAVAGENRERQHAASLSVAHERHIQAMAYEREELSKERSKWTVERDELFSSLQLCTSQLHEQAADRDRQFAARTKAEQELAAAKRELDLLRGLHASQPSRAPVLEDGKDEDMMSTATKPMLLPGSETPVQSAPPSVRTVATNGLSTQEQPKAATSSGGIVYHIIGTQYFVPRHAAGAVHGAKTAMSEAHARSLGYLPQPGY